jgi:membrane-associated protease RseP (regulator of RpoE activity)
VEVTQVAARLGFVVRKVEEQEHEDAGLGVGPHERDHADPLGRPLGIVGLADRVQATKVWSARRGLMLAISLSVAMGLFNLLPFPGLDGGRLCIEAVQAARRRRLPTRSLIAIQVTGGSILLAAWLLLTAFEIYRW